MAVMLNQAIDKILSRRQGGEGTLKITHFKVGTATPYEVDPTQTDLISPVNIGSATKKAIESAVISNHVLTITCKLSISECVGENITELGLVDSGGDVVCIKTFAAKSKTAENEMIFKIKDTFAEVQ